MARLPTLARSLLIALLASRLEAQSDWAKLVQLNRGYVDAFMKGDAAWYDTHLAPEFECLCPDGSVVRRADFLAAAQRPMTNRSFNLDSVRVKLLGDVAVITAITPFVRADGTTGTNRYTDIWVKRSGSWLALQAQITPVRGR
ncbi:MAG TPA: nuclear transport factor 2 family protein [Gemmatimonadaceae bacterium]|jgi:hypothetical protein|nr:nuclear transport factor 2 family protein [Gemmatimonadaceae bacterium]